MFKFLLKLIVFVVLVGGVLLYLSSRSGQVPDLLSRYVDLNLVRQFTPGNLASLGPQISSALDSLVTHPGRSPVVLGLQVTNDSLNSLVDLIQRLPPDQVTELKNIICAPPGPTASPSPALQ